jgi:hypothetical protein
VLIILGVLLLIVIVGHFVRRGAAAAGPMPNLRLEVLQSTEPAIVMDIAYPGAIASIVCAATGDASLYISTGGGILGGIGHERVRNAAIAFVNEGLKSRFETTSDFSYPSEGSVRFFVVTPDGVHGAEADKQTLEQGWSPLTPLYAAGQNVVTELRKVTPR